MKLALLSVFLALPMFAAVHQRTVEIEKSKYIVSYDVPERGLVQITEACPSGIFYGATITVFRREGRKRVQVGAPFAGKWTEKGCFEDDPKTLTDYALKHQNDGKQLGDTGINPPNSLSAIGGDITCIAPDCAPATARIPIWSQCSEGQIELRPEVSANNVVTIKARVCREGKWEDARVQTELGGGTGVVHIDGSSCYASYPGEIAGTNTICPTK